MQPRGPAEEQNRSNLAGALERAAADGDMVASFAGLSLGSSERLGPEARVHSPGETSKTVTKRLSRAQAR